MNPALWRAWIDALRSGEYRQGQGTLRSQRDEYCCLGVLCVVGGQTVDQCTMGQPTQHNVRLYDWIQGPAGIRSVGDLITLNDRSRATFPAIADWVEEHLRPAA